MPRGFLKKTATMSRSVVDLKSISDRELTEALARTPVNYHVIWSGRQPSVHNGSITARSIQLIREIWEPIPLRILLQRAARISGYSGFDPDAVREAVRRHQGAARACYFLAARLAHGDYVAVTDVPYPSSGARLRAGDVVLGSSGLRFDEDGSEVQVGVSSAHCSRRRMPGVANPPSLRSVHACGPAKL